MVDSTIVFVHYDDQPDLVSWVPRNLECWFWRHCRKEAQMGKRLQENEEETEFSMSIGFSDGCTTLKYLILQDEAAAWEASSSFKDQVAAFIIDQAIAGDYEAGSRFYKRLISDSPNLTAKLIMLTAYPREASIELGWNINDEKLVVKPPDPSRLTQRLLTAIVEVFPGLSIGQLIGAVLANKR